jgi:hypothetical protein
MTQERELEQHEVEQEREIEQHKEEAPVDSGVVGGSASETTTVSKKWMARSQTTWPTYVMNAGEVNEDGKSLDQRMLTRLSRVCGLAARQRVPLTLEKFEDLIEDEKKWALHELYSTIHCIFRRAEREGKEGSYEGHLSFVEGLQKQTCDVFEKKVEPIQEVQRLERRRLKKIYRKVRISRVCSEQWVHAATPSVEWAQPPP